MAARSVHVKRVYEPSSRADGLRVLVDRLWPRGITKQKAKVDLWLKALAPSNELRKRFHHDPELWPDFRKAYAKELNEPEAREALKELRGQLMERPVTLLFAARDEEHNNAVALKQFLLKKR
ncbi:MAG: DUF488 domain-containing protein [Alphaproteobacteria bacterium]|nr:DUF488 domain-containing protein [Alphaproteobacteria bacterium]